MAQSIKLNNNIYFDAAGIYDPYINSTQTTINNKTLRRIDGSGTSAIIYITVHNAARAGFLIYLGGSAGALGALYFVNVYNPNEFRIQPLCDTGGYTLSQIAGTTNIQTYGADQISVIPVSADALSATVTISTS